MMKLFFVLLPIVSSGLRLKADPEILVNNANLNAIDPLNISLQASEKTWLGSFLDTVQQWWFFWYYSMQYWCNFWTFGRCGGGHHDKITLTGAAGESCDTVCTNAGGWCNLGRLKQSARWWKTNCKATNVGPIAPSITSVANLYSCKTVTTITSTAAYAPFLKGSSMSDWACNFGDAGETTCAATPGANEFRLCDCRVNKELTWKVSADSEDCSTDTCRKTGVTTGHAFYDRCSKADQNKVSAVGITKFMLTQATPVTVASTTKTDAANTPQCKTSDSTCIIASTTPVSDCTTDATSGSKRICACHYKVP